jgi:hypothetical protein
MTNETRQAAATASHEPDPLRYLALKDLLSVLAGSVKRLAGQEVELVRAELRSNLKSTLATTRHLGIAAVCGLLGVQMLLVASVFALSSILPGWACALVLGTLFLVIGAAMAAMGWSRRVRKPLEETRASLKENLEWAKERLS